jgi:transcription-repair coupling factor (superfamily II helicase)
VDFRCDCFLPKDYIPSEGQRMEQYKRIARIRNYADYEDALDELCDRYGDPPAAAVNLLRASLSRALGMACGIRKIEETGGELRFIPERIDPAEVMRLAGAFPKLGLHVILAGTPCVACRVRGGREVPSLAVDLLRKYEEIRRETAVKETP